MLCRLDRALVKFLLLCFAWTPLVFLSGCTETGDPKPKLVLNSLQIDNESLLQGVLQNVPLNNPIIMSFNMPIDTSSVRASVSITDDQKNPIALTSNFSNGNRTISVYPKESLKTFTEYTIQISDELTDESGKASFTSVDYTFVTLPGTLVLESITAGNVDLTSNKRIINVPLDLQIRATFSGTLDQETINSDHVILKRKNKQVELSATVQGNVLLLEPAEPMDYYSIYEIRLDTAIRGLGAVDFNGFETTFYTELDSTLKFPEISDDDLLTLVQQQTFKYFYDFAGPNSGMARERNTAGNTVTSGGSGFGIMALIVGMERGFISRIQGVERMEKIVTFLETADRFHGVYPHWMDDVTGNVIPFSTKDNGGDLVETSFLFQGLITLRQYMRESDSREALLIDRINSLWNEVEWDWHTMGGQNVLYWHWSPTYNWDMNFALRGYYEAMITYVLAASSSTHTIPKEAYHQGWMRNGGVKNGKSFYGVTLPLGYDYGGPLFFAHYSFLGLDPRNLQDQYANYWEQNVAHSLINYEHCIQNPRNHVGYNGVTWGLTASDQHDGYSAREPTNDNGTIAPTAALSSFPYTPEESMQALRYFYYIVGDRLWGNYGFYDAYNVNEGWWASSTLAIDQGPIIVMIENHRTGLLWDLFMSAPEIQAGLTKLEISTN